MHEHMYLCYLSVGELDHLPTQLHHDSIVAGRREHEHDSHLFLQVEESELHAKPDPDHNHTIITR